MSSKIEFHVIQNFVPANLNRDDTGAPKDTVFGGVRRARISSQAIKRAVRMHMYDDGLIPVHARGYRTKRIVFLIAEELEARGINSENALALAEAGIATVGAKKKMKVKDGKTDYLVFVSAREVEQIAEALMPEAENHKNGKYKLSSEATKAITTVLHSKAEGAVDVGLFGRMLANLPEGNTDAACQVAHAISTHRVDREFDYYTAVDDERPGDTAGADMIGTVEFNSSCFYRYSVVDLDQLSQNLNDRQLAATAARAYTKSMAEAIPTGKQNSFAAHNPPSMILVVLRKNQVLRNLANAFEEPVSAREGGYARASIAKLAEHWRDLDAAYGNADQAWLLDPLRQFPDTMPVQRLESLEALVNAVGAAAGRTLES